MMGNGWDFAQGIEGVLAAGGVGAITRALEPGNAGMPRDASLMEHPRVMVCLEGRAVYEMKRGEAVTKVTLEPRDGLFVAPVRWVRARPREPYLLLGVVFYANATRFYLMRGRPARDGGPGVPAENHVVPAALGESGRALCRMLAEAAPVSEPERFVHHAFECLLIAARELLALPPQAADESGKARFTWQAACDFIEHHLHRPLSRKDVARHLRVHPNHLSRLFARFGGETFSEHVQSRRLERARLLLDDPRLNIAEVARLSGFGSGNYFARVFRARTGQTPTRSRG